MTDFSAWHRTPESGPWNDHIHSIALADPDTGSGIEEAPRGEGSQ